MLTKVATSRQEFEQAMGVAIGAFNIDRLEVAADMCQSLLRIKSGDPAVHQLLEVVCLQQQKAADTTVTNMKQNLWSAVIYNVLAIPVAAGVLYPLTGWLLSPMIAALTLSVSSVSVIGNALRLKHTKLAV